MIEPAQPQITGLGRQFRLYATGRAVSVIGDRIALIALVFLVIHVSHAFAPALALFYVARLFPTLLGGLVAGVLVDHFDRRNLMVACDVGRAALLTAVPGVNALTLWTLYPAVIMLYAFTLLFDTAARAALPDVVAEDNLTRANSALQAIDSGADLAYAVGGSLIFVLGLKVPFYLDAGTFVFSALMVSAMQIPSRLAGPRPDLGEVVLRIRAGIAYLFSHPFLKWSTLVFTLAPLAGGLTFVLVPLYADRVLVHSWGLIGPLRSGAFRFSVLEVSLGMGALIGTVATTRLARHWPRGQLFGLGILGMGSIDLLFAAITNVYIAVPVMCLHGLFNSLFVISGITLVQELTPSEMRGRVVAARATIITSTLALGSALGGVLLVFLEYWTLWLLIGGLIALSSLGVWLRPAVRRQA